MSRQLLALFQSAFPPSAVQRQTDNSDLASKGSRASVRRAFGFVRFLLLAKAQRIENTFETKELLAHHEVSEMRRSIAEAIVFL